MVMWFGFSPSLVGKEKVFLVPHSQKKTIYSLETAKKHVIVNILT